MATTERAAAQTALDAADSMLRKALNHGHPDVSSEKAVKATAQGALDAAIQNERDQRIMADDAKEKYVLAKTMEKVALDRRDDSA